MDFQFHSLNCRGNLIDLSFPKIMGILNITPDSFSDGGKFSKEKEALLHAEKMITEGADIIDIGAQSTRPKAEKILAQEEILRLGKIISNLKKEFPDILLSLDTYYSKVVKFGYDAGIDLINDISGGQYDPEMYETVASTGLPYIIMHTNKEYDTMHDKTINDDILLHLNSYFSEKTAILLEKGIKDIIIDPGIGFGKMLNQNHQLLNDIDFLGFGRFPVLVGVSRKSFIYKPLGKLPTEVISETQALHLKALEKGVKILRVHDVKETQATLQMFLEKNRTQDSKEV